MARPDVRCVQYSENSALAHSGTDSLHRDSEERVTSPDAEERGQE